MIIKGKFWLLILCLTPSYCASQTGFSTLFDEGTSSEPLDIELIGDSILVVAGNDLTSSCGEPFVLTYDLQGDLIWRFLADPFVNPIQKLRWYEGALYAAGFNSSLSDVDTERALVLTKFSQEGEVLLTAESPVIDTVSFGSFLVRDMAISAEGRVAILADSLLAFSDLDGSFEEPISIPIPAMFRLHYLSETQVVIADSSSIRLVGVDGSQSSPVTFQDDLVDVLVEDVIWVATQTKLYKLDDTLSMLDSLNVSGSFEEVYQLTASPSEIYVQGKAENQIGMLTVQKDFSESSLQGDIFLNRSLVKPLNGGWKGATQIPTEKIPQNTLSFYVPLEGKVETNESIDIAIRDFSITAARANELTPIEGVGTLAREVTFDFLLELENQGVETIEKFIYEIPELNSTFCISGLVEKKNLSILPSERLKLNGQIFLSSIFTNQSIEFCARALVPNAQLEANVSQNVLCDSVLVERLIVSRDRELLEGVSIFPNPVKNKLRIGYEGVFSRYMTVSIFSSLGVLMEEFPLSTQKMEITLSTYPQGLYFIEVRRNNSSYWQKIVKE